MKGTDKHEAEARSPEPQSSEGGGGDHGAGSQVESEVGGAGVPFPRETPITPASGGRAQCRAVKKDGNRCGSFPTQPGGYCIAHSGKLDMAEIGRKGGKSQETQLRKVARDDDELREKARHALAQALDGKDEKRRFEAAKSLFSYRAAAPPEEQQRREAEVDHAGGFGLCDLVELALFGDESGPRVLLGGGDGDPLRNDPEWRALGARIAARLESIRVENGNHPEAA